MWEIGFHFSEGEKPPRGSNKAVGKRLESADQPHVILCRLNGFTFSRLTPYAEWQDLRANAERQWRAFINVVQPKMVTRLAVRYINAMQLPLPMRDFQDFLTCPPRIPEPLPQEVSAFVQRMVIPDRESGAVAIVTQALEGFGAERAADAGATVTVLLDLDVFTNARIEDPSTDEMWPILDSLRDLKNRMFFEHIQERTAEMFE